MIDVKHVVLDRDTVIDHNESASPLGPAIFDLPDGPALCHDAISTTVIQAVDTDGQFVILVQVAEFGRCHLGSLARLLPDGARNLALSLIAAADQCGPVQGAH